MELNDKIAIFAAFAAFAAVFATYHTAYKQRKQTKSLDDENKKLPFERQKRQDWPLVDNLPDAPRPILGRDGELARLAEMVEDSHVAAVTGHRKNQATLRGPGGIGKTELATEYARRNKQTYKGVWKIEAESETGLQSALAELGAKLNIPKSEKPKATAIAVLHNLRDRAEPWLILFDNVPDYKTIQPYLVSGGQLHCLITSRHARWDGIASFDVGTLKAPEAEALLRQISGRETEDLSPVLEVLDGYPLALVAAGGYLNARPNETAAQYLANFNARLKDPVEDGYTPAVEKEVPSSIFGSVSLSIDALDTNARHLLSLAAYLSPDDLWLEMIANEDKLHDRWQKGAHPWPAFIEAIRDKPALLSDAVAGLKKTSLLRREGEGADTRLVLHRLTQAVIRARLRHNGDRWADAAARIVNAYVTHDFDEPAQWPRYARLLPQSEALLPHAPPSAASDRCFSQCGGYLHARGDYPGAIRFQQRAVGISAEINGADTALHALHLNNLASSQEDNGDWAEAEAGYKTAIAIDETVYGDHPATARDTNNLAGLYWRQKRFAEAEPLFQRAVKIDEATLGADHPSLAVRFGNLGSLYDTWTDQLGGNAQKQAEAARYTSDALAITRRARGEMHPETATRLNNIAILYHRQGNSADAITAMRRALVILLDLSGQEHPNTQTAVQTFAAMGGTPDQTTLDAELADVRQAHVAWGINKLAEIAARHGPAHNTPAPHVMRGLSDTEKGPASRAGQSGEAPKPPTRTEITTLAQAVQAESARLDAEGAPDQKSQWPLTEFNGAIFALQQGIQWGIITPPDD